MGILVDPYHLNDDEFIQFHSDGHLEQRQGAAHSNVFPFRHRATFMAQRSIEAASWIRPGFLDLVFIDGDHRYEAVLKDLHAWWPTLKEDGILAGHDYTVNHPGVAQAVHEFAAEKNVTLYLGLEIWYMIPQSNGFVFRL